MKFGNEMLRARRVGNQVKDDIMQQLVREFGCVFNELNLSSMCLKIAGSFHTTSEVGAQYRGDI